MRLRLRLLEGSSLLKSLHRGLLIALVYDGDQIATILVRQLVPIAAGVFDHRIYPPGPAQHGGHSGRPAIENHGGDALIPASIFLNEEFLICRGHLAPVAARFLYNSIHSIHARVGDSRRHWLLPVTP